MARRTPGLVAASVRAPQAPIATETRTTAAAAERASRDGKRMVAAWVDQECWLALRMDALKQNLTAQEIVARELDLYFRERGLPEIASAKRESVGA